MKRFIKKILVKIVHPIAIKLGYQQPSTKKANFHKNSLLEILFSNLKNIGFHPKHIIDVGANHGTWTRVALNHFPNAHFTLLEPQYWLKPSFQDILDSYPKVKFYPMGAGKEDGKFMFTIVDRDDSCSFRYTEEEAKKAGFEQVEIPVISLDTIVKQNDFPFPDIVKIDAEGLDIEVLKGATTLFGKTEVFMVEVGVFNKEFDNSFLKMINFMDEKGYRLFEITELNRPFSPKILWLAEVVFVKKNGIIDTYKLHS